MKKQHLNPEAAKHYSIEKFKALPPLYAEWNKIHSEGIIEILKSLSLEKTFDMERVSALAWVHDIGKIKSDDGHAKLSYDILNNDFELTEEDVDCIVNHGSSSMPTTKIGKIFRYADGLSLFTSKSVAFQFYSGQRENLSFEQVKENIVNQYRKYRDKYSDNRYVIELLDSLFQKHVWAT